LIDSGASHNFIRSQTVAESEKLKASVRDENVKGKLVIRLADGKTLKTDRREIDLRLMFSDFNNVDGYTLFDMDDKYDIILGMQWLTQRQPYIDWVAKSVGSTLPPTEPRVFNALEGNDASIEHLNNSNLVPESEREGTKVQAQVATTLSSSIRPLEFPITADELF
jgi:hypothetical protein